MYVLETLSNTMSDVKDVLSDGLSNTKEAICDFLDEDTTVKKRTIAIIILVAALIGLIYGLIIAPKKKVVIETCDWEDDWEDSPFNE